jgi:hypothetical protein
MRLVLRIALNRQPGYRRLVSAVLLITFVATAAGIPLPVVPLGANSKNPNEDFICATSTCGCATAEQCWRSCCCHTLGERLAWARAKGVRPPGFAIAQARAAGHDLSWLEVRPGTQVKLVCRSGNCQKEDHRAIHSCCDRASHNFPAKAARSCCTTKHKADLARSVIAWQALKCGGHSMNWLAATPTLVGVQFDLRFKIAPSAWLRPSAPNVAGRLADLPSVPPPEWA